MRMVFETAKAFGANGIILWGSSSDLTTKYDFDYVFSLCIYFYDSFIFLLIREKCMQFKTYLDTVLGPISKEFITKSKILFS